MWTVERILLARGVNRKRSRFKLRVWQHTERERQPHSNFETGPVSCIRSLRSCSVPLVAPDSELELLIELE
jgi:hypothetical protein